MTGRDLLEQYLINLWPPEQDDVPVVTFEGREYDLEDDVDLEAAAQVLIRVNAEGGVPDALRRAEQEGAEFLGEEWEAWMLAHEQRGAAQYLRLQGIHSSREEFAEEVFSGMDEIPEGIVVDWEATADNLLSTDYIAIELNPGASAYFRRS